MKLSDLDWLDNIYKSINLENLPHGIIINGPKGIGKEIFAKELASELLLNKNTLLQDCDLLDANNHPDYFILQKDKILLHHITFRKTKWDEEKGQRNINDFLGITPSIAINKVALILNAQTMNNECQNALLKNLEEPAPNSYIIMVTDRSNVLLETIYSRCQIFNIPNLSSKEMNAWLSKRGISEINFNDFPSFYTPLKIIEDIENDRHLIFKKFISVISDYINNKSDIGSLIKDLSSMDINLITKTNYLIEFLKILLRSKLLSEEMSGIYKIFNSSNFNNLKISNLINELNNLRDDFYRVPQINENHVLNYFLSEIKNSIKI
jgi:DNA polymerase-3 subunit delta'